MKLVFLTIFLGTCAFPQSTFEEASIKPIAPGEQCDQSLIGPMPGGGFRVECLPLKSIITWAYEVQNYQVTGGAPWIESERWNVLATVPKPANSNVPTEYEKMTDDQRKSTQDLVHSRAQTLLTERFQLTLRHESREQIVYALVIAKNGPKMTESADQTKSGFMVRRRAQIESRGSGMEMLAQYLGIALERPVLDRTSLTKHYDFKLEWRPDSAEAKEDSGPSLFTAIQEQLGLKLESVKAPVEMLVIESAAKPEN